MYGWIEYGRVEYAWAAHTGAEVGIFSESLFLPSGVELKSSWLYNIPDAHANLYDHFSSNMLPTQCARSCFLLACYPGNLRGISAENMCILFTLGSRWIFCYFRLTRVRLPPLHRQMSKRSSNQYLTQGPVLIRSNTE